MLMIDPKMVELSGYGKLPHLMHPVVTDMKKAEAILAWAVDKMEERYQLLARAGVRHVSVYNQLSEEELRERIATGRAKPSGNRFRSNLPFIVIVADEMADLMMTAGKRRRATYHSARAEEPGGRHPPDPRDAEADGRRDHGPDQVEPAGADRLPGREPHG